MADVVIHNFVSAKTQSPDTTLVSKNEWNDGHAFSGGINGQVLLYDNTQENNMRWTENSTFYSNSFALSVSPTNSPINNVALVTFAPTTSIGAILIFAVRPVSTTGLVTASMSFVLDGVVDASAYAFPSGTITTILRPISLTAGSHTISQNWSAAASFTLLFIDTFVITFGT